MKTQYTFESDYMQMGFHEGVLMCKFKAITLDYSIAKECVIDRKKFSDGKHYPLLIDGSDVISFPRKGREYMGTKEASEFVLASAMVIDSQANRMMANFYFQIFTPPVPTKIFTNVEIAFDWLKTFQEQQPA